MRKFDFLNIVADNQDVDVYITGELVADDMKEVYDWFGINSASASEFKAVLNEHKGKNLTVHINSVGGSFLVGVEIYNAIMDFKGKTTAVIDGLAASAATLPLVACDKVKMSAPSTIMIHEALLGHTAGNIADLEKDIAMLKSINDSIANAYEIKTNIPRDEILALMKAETWLDCKEAKRLGFADEIDDRLALPDNVIKNIVENHKAVYAVANKSKIPIQPQDPAPTVMSYPTNNSESLRALAEFELIKNKRIGV